MPNITDLTNSISSARVFTKLDLLKGYFQVPVHPAYVPKTAIITPFGSYVFHYFRFGLKNSGATFQRMMYSSSVRSSTVLYTWTTCLCSRTITRNINYTWGKCSPYSVRMDLLCVQISAPLLYREWTFTAIGSAQMAYTPSNQSESNTILPGPNYD